MARSTKSTKTAKKSSGGRGSKEAIEKRRVARQLNTLLTSGAKKRTLDGRTEKRRQRLIDELKNGRNGTPLKPHDVLQRTNDLLAIGETLATLRKQGVRPRRVELDEEAIEVIRRHTKAFNFDPRAWRMLGLRVDADGNLVSAGRGSSSSKTARKASTKKSAKKPTKKPGKGRARR